MVGRARRTGVALVVVLTASVVFGPPHAGAQDSAGEPPREVRPVLGTDTACDPETGELVISGEWSNPSDLEVRFVDLRVELHLAIPGTEPVEFEIVDVTQIFPTELAPHEAVAIGPERIPVDEWWNLGLGGEFVVEGFDPVPLASTLELNAPCTGVELPEPPPVEEPAEPIEEMPRFTG